MSSSRMPGSPNVWASALARGQADRIELKYQVTLITPMLGGGVVAGVPDANMPFRAKGIKGHLRAWWRVLAQAGDLDAHKAVTTGEVSLLTPIERREREASLWGLLGSGRPTASAVEVITHALNAPTENPPYEVDRKPNHVHFGELAEEYPEPFNYGYFPAKRQKGKQPRDPLQLIPAGSSFSLRLLIHDPSRLAEVRAAVAAWATFGGVGARTRRGVGAVQVLEELQTTPPQLICDLDAAEFTGKALCVAGMPELPDAVWAQQLALQHLWAFRQQPSFARFSGVRGHPGRSRWPEPDAIRRLAGKDYRDVPDQDNPLKTRDHSASHPAGNIFPRAAFGMPLAIRFHYKQAAKAVDEDHFDPIERTLLPMGGSGDLDRMASPLIIRPVAVQAQDGTIRYCPVAAVLMHHPSHTLTQVRIKPPAGSATTGDVWNPAWSTGAMSGIDPIDQAYAARPMFDPPLTAVQAFMNYFAGKA